MWRCTRSAANTRSLIRPPDGGQKRRRAPLLFTRRHLALPLYEDALEKGRAALGEEHPSTLTSLNNLALCYKRLGEAHRALSLFKAVLDKQRLVLAPRSFLPNAAWR